MANEQQHGKQQQEPARSKAILADTPSISVSRATFDRPIDLPGKTSATAIKVETQSNREQYQIDYLPSLRHHRITHTRDGISSIAMVSESRVTNWVPA